MVLAILRNYSEVNTYIAIDKDGYSVVNKKEAIGVKRQGVGGFCENEFVGMFVENQNLYLCYNDKIFPAQATDIDCSNLSLSSGKRRFILRLAGNKVCDILYDRVINPFPAIEEDEEEYDALLYLSNLLESKDTIDNFIDSMTKLNT
jgi:hypothetical protein